MSDSLFLVENSRADSKHQPIQEHDHPDISLARVEVDPWKPAAVWNEVPFLEPVYPSPQHTWLGKCGCLHQASIVGNPQSSESYLAHSQVADMQTISNLVFSKVITEQTCTVSRPKRRITTHWTAHLSKLTVTKTLFSLITRICQNCGFICTWAETTYLVGTSLLFLL